MRIEKAAVDCRPGFFGENVVYLWVLVVAWWIPLVDNRCLITAVNADENQISRARSSVTELT